MILFARAMRTLGVLALAGMVLSGCATVARVDASADIHAFLVAVRDGDREEFDAHVDRAALKTNLKARVLAETSKAYGLQSKQTLGALIARPLVGLAVDALVQPEVFQAAAMRLGYGPQTRVPNPILLSKIVKPLGTGRVCVETKKDGCLFVFANEDGVWRMIDFEGDLGLIERKFNKGIEG